MKAEIIKTHIKQYVVDEFKKNQKIIEMLYDEHLKSSIELILRELSIYDIGEDFLQDLTIAIDDIDVLVDVLVRYTTQDNLDVRETLVKDVEMKLGDTYGNFDTFWEIVYDRVVNDLTAEGAVTELDEIYLEDDEVLDIRIKDK